MKETNAQKIQRYHTIAKVNPKYRNLCNQHLNKEITDSAFLFECDKIWVNRGRGGFISLNERQNEHKPTNKKV